MAYKTIPYSANRPVRTITLNRPNACNMFNAEMCIEIRNCIEAIRTETRTRGVVLTGAGDKFFSTGGRKDGLEKTNLYAGVLPTLEMYDAIERLQKQIGRAHV